MRVLFRRLRIGFYAAGSAFFAATCTDSRVLQAGKPLRLTGMLVAMVLFMMAVLLELLDLHFGKGGAHDN